MSGLLNKVLTTGELMHIATVPEGDVKYSLVNVLVINPTAAPIEAKLYATNQMNPTLVDLLDHRVVLVANGGRAEYSCGTMSPGEKIFIEAPAGLVVRVTSIDEDQ